MTINDFVGRLNTGVREIRVDPKVANGKHYVMFGHLFISPEDFSGLEQDKNLKYRVEYINGKP